MIRRVVLGTVGAGLVGLALSGCGKYDSCSDPNITGFGEPTAVSLDKGRLYVTFKQWGEAPGKYTEVRAISAKGFRLSELERAQGAVESEMISEEIHPEEVNNIVVGGCYPGNAEFEDWDRESEINFVFTGFSGGYDLSLEL